MIARVLFVSFIGFLVAASCVIALSRDYAVGPAVVLLSIFPLAGLLASRRNFWSASPDMIFGAIDTGLLTIPAIWGGALFGVAGAIAGGVIGDALTDAIAGFFEGGVAEWLRERGIEESRDPVTTALGKMAGCLLGSGLILTAALSIGVDIRFG